MPRTNLKDVFVHVRVDAELRHLLEKLAQAEGRNRSQVLRRLIRGAAEELTPLPDPEPAQETEGQHGRNNI